MNAPPIGKAAGGGRSGLPESTFCSKFNLAAKILCKVMNIQPRAKPDTDEVYAQITLLPDQDQSEVTVPDPPLLEPSTCMVHSICKTLTTSETSTSDGLSFPLRHAVDCLPPLDISQQPPPWQEVVGSDLQDNEWRFSHMLQAHPQRHLLTTGWRDFVNAKKLVPGDAFVFLREENGELCVTVRRHMSLLNYTPSFVHQVKVILPSLLLPPMQFQAEPIFQLHISQGSMDEPSSILRPDRVSPRDLEPLVVSNPSGSQPQTEEDVEIAC